VNSTAPADCPAHVPAGLVREFDCHFDPAFALDPVATFDRHRELRAFWSPALGGFWVFTRLEDIREALQQPDLFSSRVFSLAANYPRRLIPEGLDPPEHGKYRQVLAPLFSPGAAARMEAQVRSVAAGLVEGFAADGGCEFAAAFARPFPTAIFLSLTGLPASEAETFAAWNHKLVHGYDDPGGRTAAGRAIADYLVAFIERRRAEGAAGDDVIGALLAGRIDGRPLSDDEIYDTIFLLFMAGLDTVTAALGFAFRFLADRPEHRRRLVADPGLIPKAVEEMLRAYSIVNPARFVTRDATFAGVELRAGDRVLLSTTLADRDPDAFADAEAVDFDRAANRHIAFGAGPHRCLGSHLARLELRVALEEFHARIPDYELAPGAVIVGHGGGVLGLDEVPLVWRAQHGGEGR
jgi:cytochrome P450